MENYLAKIKGEIKTDLINHYDWVKSEIDYLIHRKLENVKLVNNEMETKTFDYSKLIELCNKIFTINMNQVNEYFDKNKFDKNYKKLNKEIVKETILNKYCIFIGNRELQEDLTNYLIGHMIVSDCYIDVNQYNFLK
jgi:hypothetical protein